MLDLATYVDLDGCPMDVTVAIVCTDGPDKTGLAKRDLED